MFEDLIDNPVFRGLKRISPHLDSQLPYGYSFHSMYVFEVSYEQNLSASAQLSEYEWSCIDVEGPVQARVLWELARHIEGGFGPPYRAVILCKDTCINIYTPKGDRWWCVEHVAMFRQYLIGLRSLLDLIPKE